jgi:hypothetical protein
VAEGVPVARSVATLPGVLDLDRALCDVGLPRLPVQAERLLRVLSVPPRLAAHLRAVHAAACELTDWFDEHHAGFSYDRDAVLFGAAIHDIGKAAHPKELSGPGSAHEQAGYRLLLTHGVDDRLARFARTHASWDQPGIEIEDLLVSLADKVWKAKRVTELEDLVVGRLATATSRELWDVFSGFDQALERIAQGADDRLAFQSRYPVVG